LNATYRLRADELDANFLEGLKKLFQAKEIEIVVSDLDDTEYLLGTPANRDHLLAAVASVEANRNLAEVRLPGSP
jgi:antitoxin YefM